jgi:pseudouridine-5'-monophosphatase
MDGLLLDTEDLYTKCINIILERYGRPNLPWSVKAQLQGRPAPESDKLFHNWANLPISREQYREEFSALQREKFPTAGPLPGVQKLLGDLGRTRWWDVKRRRDGTEERRVHIALATSTYQQNFLLKTNHLTELFSVFSRERRVLGDDKRIQEGRGKPQPDIFLLALQTINDSLPEDEPKITPEECLVFEDSVPGVEAGRRAGMRVVWVPHPGLKKEYEGREKEVLAGATGEAGNDLEIPGEEDDGWAEYLPSLEEFSCEKYGMNIPPLEVEEDPEMQERAGELSTTDDTLN